LETLRKGDKVERGTKRGRPQKNKSTQKLDYSRKLPKAPICGRPSLRNGCERDRSRRKKGGSWIRASAGMRTSRTIAPLLSCSLGKETSGKREGDNEKPANMLRSETICHKKKDGQTYFSGRKEDLSRFMKNLGSKMGGQGPRKK